MKKKFLLLFVSLLSLTTVAQDTEFWFATPIQIYGSGSAYRGHGGFVFTNPTHRQAVVNIEYYKDRSSDTTIFIPPYSYNHCYYPTKARITSLVEEITTANFGNPNFSGAVHITSNVSVMVYYITDYIALQETFLLKGKVAHGTAFSILGAKGGTMTSTTGSQPLGISRAPYLSIAGTENSTTVNVKLTGDCANYSAGNHTVTLDKGKVLILRGTSRPVNLNGSYITSDKPIVITAGTEGRSTGPGADDQCADQLVADAFAGNVYVTPLTAGFTPNDAAVRKVMNYMEITALESNTNMQIDWGEGLMPLGTLTNAGDVFFSDSFSVYRQNSCATIVADKPIHVMQVTGYEASMCHVPNFYATNTHQTSFYSYWELFSGKNIDPGVTLVYLDNSKDGITIDYPGQPQVPLFDWITNNGVIVNGQGNVPQFQGWKYIRFTLPNPSNPLATPTTAPAAINKIVTVKSKTSVFQLAISSSFFLGTNLTYLTAFNAEFSFDPDTVWTCPGIYTNLIGGIASHYKWTLPDGSIREAADLNSVKAVQMGMYILEMTQGFNTVSDTCWVESVHFSKNGTIGKSLTKPFKVNKPQEFLPSIDEAVAQYMTEFKWTFEGGTPATSTDATPTVVFNTTGIKEVTLYMKYETVYPDSTVAVCDSFLVVRIPVQPERVDYYVDPSVPHKVGTNDQDKTNNELFTEGQSPENPFNLEDALKQASQGDIIHIPGGVYTPVNRKSFVIDCDGVTLLGSLPGSGSSVEHTVIRGNGGSAVIFELGSAVGACGITTATRLEGVTIEGGTAENGGGILFKGGASGTIANCIIRNNRATENGGGVYTTPYGGCGTSADPIFYNVEISGNTARRGGGMYNDSNTVTFTNVTIGGNAASIAGGGVYNEQASPGIMNTIIYGNVTAGEPLKDEFISDGGLPRISSSNLSGSNGSGIYWNPGYGTDGGRNIDKGPLYKISGYEATTGSLRKGNYRLSYDSQSVNKGYNGYVIGRIHTDLDGHERIMYDIVDMGAYEYVETENPTRKHEIKIPLLSHVTTEPPVGLHYAVGHTDFTVVFTPKEGYSLANLKITTGSVWQDERGAMKMIHNEDGSVTVIFRRVTEPLDIQLTGVSPVSNEMIDNVYAVWSGSGQLYVKTSKGGTLKVYSLMGALVRQAQLSEGEHSYLLNQGVYIVTLNDGQQQKIVIQ